MFLFFKLLKSSVNNCTGRSASDEKPPSGTAVPADKTAPDDSSVTDLAALCRNVSGLAQQGISGHDAGRCTH